MSNARALLDCTFGWGRTCRLYEDSIEVAGKAYNLHDLTSIQPTYRKLFGIPSASLELSFGLQRLTLRGIPEPDKVRLIVSHLLTYCSLQMEPERHSSRSPQARDLARAQARAWERTHKLPIVAHSPRKALMDEVFMEGELELETLRIPVSLQPAPVEPTPDHDEPILSLDSDELLEELPHASEQPTTTLISTMLEQSVPEIYPPSPQSSLMPRLQPPLRSVHLVHPQHRALDSCSMPAMPVLKSSALPIIHVPVRLQPGECAHYSIGATLCSDRAISSSQTSFQPLDYGLLILTNRRIFYVGKRCQLVLPYIHLWYVSLLHTAIALHIEGQFRRIIIEVDHAQEWASRIDQLAFVARRASLAPARLPVSNASELGMGITFKRQALKAPFRRKEAFDYEQPMPRAQKIVDASTISLDEPDEVELLSEQAHPQPTLAASQAEIDAYQQELDEIKTILLHARGGADADEFTLFPLENLPTLEFGPDPAREPASYETTTLDNYRTTALENQPTLDFPSPARTVIEAYPTAELDVFKTAALENQPTREFTLVSSNPADGHATAPLDEVETIALHPIPGGAQSGPPPIDDQIRAACAGISEDETTICLPKRHQTYSQHPLQRGQTRRKLSEHAEAEDTTPRIRRLTRSRIKKRL